MIVFPDDNLPPSGSAAKQAFRKQQLRTWKLQQQREQEEKRRQEEEERRKREDEIRRIRDLSNQDEQYNRFMKLVGGKTRTRSKVRGRFPTGLQLHILFLHQLICPLFFQLILMVWSIKHKKTVKNIHQNREKSNATSSEDLFCLIVERG